ncbi:hypothetical protein CRENBAI_026021 [Crenichthys baileyi]|uniref:Transmembrane protein n=1 Tax=Crenichthys baileyi TaxID=28760 RepID=A0AAV9RZZ8_9TELE
MSTSVHFLSSFSSIGLSVSSFPPDYSHLLAMPFSSPVFQLSGCLYPLLDHLFAHTFFAHSMAEVSLCFTSCSVRLLSHWVPVVASNENHALCIPVQTPSTCLSVSCCFFLSSPQMVLQHLPATCLRARSVLPESPRAYFWSPPCSQAQCSPAPPAVHSARPSSPIDAAASTSSPTSQAQSSSLPSTAPCSVIFFIPFFLLRQGGSGVSPSPEFCQGFLWLPHRSPVFLKRFQRFHRRLLVDFPSPLVGLKTFGIASLQGKERGRRSAKVTGPGTRDSRIEDYSLYTWSRA